MIEGAQYVDGRAAVHYHAPIPRYVKIGNSEYVCDVRHGVAMLLVTEEEVAPLLAYEEGCNCGNGKRHPFTLSSLHALNVWREGHY